LSATDALPSPVAIGQPLTKLGGTVLKSIAAPYPKRHWLFCFWAKEFWQINMINKNGNLVIFILSLNLIQISDGYIHVFLKIMVDYLMLKITFKK
jgi:hypothetical protein